MDYRDIITDPVWLKDIEARAVGVEGLANYMLRTIPVAQIARLCAEYVLGDDGAEKMVITEEQLTKHFRIQGYRNGFKIDGVKENRGAAKKFQG